MKNEMFRAVYSASNSLYVFYDDCTYTKYSDAEILSNPQNKKWKLDNEYMYYKYEGASEWKKWFDCSFTQEVICMIHDYIDKNILLEEEKGIMDED